MAPEAGLAVWSEGALALGGTANADAALLHLVADLAGLDAVALVVASGVRASWPMDRAGERLNGSGAAGSVAYSPPWVEPAGAS